MISLMSCDPQHPSFVLSNQEGEIGKACGIQWREEKPTGRRPSGQAEIRY